MHNTAPPRLFDNLLAPGRAAQLDWYKAVAANELQALYTACAAAADIPGLPPHVTDLTPHTRGLLQAALPERGPYPAGAQIPYRKFCQTVSTGTAIRWEAQIAKQGAAEIQLWRLLRLAGAPYFILGAAGHSHLRIRVATPWDWRQHFKVHRLTIAAANAGQPQVNWAADYRDLATREDRRVSGHVEIRWSHGRFGGYPEAKIYVDIPHHLIPGYFPLDSEPRVLRTSTWSAPPQGSKAISILSSKPVLAGIRLATDPTGQP